MYFVYIIQSQRDGSYYVGHTNNLTDRLNRHNQGKSKYTKTKTPWHLMYVEEFGSRSDATKRESEIKRKKSKNYIDLLIRNSKSY